MLKSKIRNKLLKTRKNSNKKNIQIKFEKIYKLLKKITNLAKFSQAHRGRQTIN